MIESTAAHPYPVISRWTTEARSKAAQDDKLMRFLLESAFFEGPGIVEDWLSIRPDSKKINPVMMAQRAGYQPRSWFHGGMHTELIWRYPKPSKPKPEPKPKPGVSKADIAAMLRVTREAVRQHALHHSFPRPIPPGRRPHRYDASEVGRYYEECARAVRDFEAAGMTRAEIVATYGISHSAVAGFALTPWFPPPIARSRGKLIYDRGEVADWWSSWWSEVEA